MTRLDGVQEKEQQLDRLRKRRAVFVRRGQRALLQRLLDRGTATADDIRESVQLPVGIDPVCFGAVPTPLARAGIIQRSGYAQSTRPNAHARPVSVWRLLDRAKALQWLSKSPDLASQPSSSDDWGSTTPECQRSLFDL